MSEEEKRVSAADDDRGPGEFDYWHRQRPGDTAPVYEVPDWIRKGKLVEIQIVFPTTGRNIVDTHGNDTGLYKAFKLGETYYGLVVRKHHYNQHVDVLIGEDVVRLTGEDLSRTIHVKEAHEPQESPPTAPVQPTREAFKDVFNSLLNKVVGQPQAPAQTEEDEKKALRDIYTTMIAQRGYRAK